MMNRKKFLIAVTFIIVLIIGLALIIPQDVWKTSDAGSLDDNASGLEGGGDVNTFYDPDGELRFVVYNNGTYSNEPVYWYDNGSYNIAYVPSPDYDDYNYSQDSTVTGSEIQLNDSLLSKDMYIYEDSDYRLVHSSGDEAQSDDAELALVPISGERNEEATIDSTGSSATWVFQSLGYAVVCTILFAFLFARLSSEDIMGGVRKDIYEYISENPGEHLAAITKEFDMSSSSARHHLHVLEASDKIVSHKPGKYKHYYVNQNGYSRFTNGSEYKAVISALRNETSRAIVKILMQGNEMNQQSLSQALSVHPSTINWHAKRLRAADILRKNKRGKDIIYSLNEEMDLGRMISIVEGTSS